MRWRKIQATNKEDDLLTDEEYVKKGMEVFEESWMLLHSKDGWDLEEKAPCGDTVHSKHFPNIGKVFKLTGNVEFPADVLLNELFYNIENVPSWNPSVKESKRLKMIDDHTDITYQVSPEYGGGLISSRDFVNLRHWELRDGIYFSAGMTITHPEKPTQQKLVRGENGPGGWVITTIPGEKKKCIFQWLLRTNLHGWLPQYVVDKTLASAMLDYIGHVRTYSAELKEQGRF